MNTIIMCDGKVVYKAGVFVGTVAGFVGACCIGAGMAAWEEKLKPMLEQRKKEKEDRKVYGSKWDF